ncbi:YfbU family protein [Photobacterium sp. 1_MG-2023]|uniref:YfbU family protein n=1 Tax=Photobacterium sp. 1_MG-2023 TaxID=3062646 RepID=UPI0026E23698|nr:YfbU family protein [Photobacterium sp. 1_MG-2023]MDO6704595.1 YfbU family protein [Photobacterium sp. 1_MG-2023]
MEMTNAQRLILSNQYRLMAQLEPDHAAKYQRLQTIVERGYGLQLRELDKDFGALSEAECKEIINVMEMHHAMQESQKQLNNHEIDSRRLLFLGFDAQSEPQQMHYVRFLTQIEHLYPGFLPSEHQFNSHVPMQSKYRRMLTVWQKCPRQYHLSATEIQQILNA